METVLTELRTIYAALVIATVLIGGAGVFFAIKYGVATNKKDIERHTGHFDKLFTARNEHETRITVIEDGIQGIRFTQNKQDEKLDDIKTLIIERNNNRQN